MLVLRATKKVLRLLPPSASATDESSTALGDWYVNRIVIDRQPLLLLVSSKSRLAILTPARDVKALPDRIGDIVADRLRRLGINDGLVGPEVEAMREVRVARTCDRSIVGQMVDFAKAIPYYIPVGTANDANMHHIAERKLADTPCLCGRSYSATIWPDRETARLLKERWSNENTRH